MHIGIYKFTYRPMSSDISKHITDATSKSRVRIRIGGKIQCNYIIYRVLYRQRFPQLVHCAHKFATRGNNLFGATQI